MNIFPPLSQCLMPMYKVKTVVSNYVYQCCLVIIIVRVGRGHTYKVNKNIVIPYVLLLIITMPYNTGLGL